MTPDEQKLFNTLYKKYKGYAQYQFYSLRFDIDTQKDLAQEYFLEITKRILRKEIIENDQWESYKMKLYLRGTVKNYILKQNSLGRTMQREAISLNKSYNDDSSILANSVRDFNCVDTDYSILKKESQELLISALKSLSTIEHQYIHDYYFKGKTLEAMGDKYGVTKQSVSQRLPFILRKLKAKLPKDMIETM